jgi:hypothetical protein
MEVIKREQRSGEGVLGYYNVYDNNFFLSLQWSFETSQQMYCHPLGNEQSALFEQHSA